MVGRYVDFDKNYLGLKTYNVLIWSASLSSLTSVRRRISATRNLVFEQNYRFSSRVEWNFVKDANMQIKPRNSVDCGFGKTIRLSLRHMGIVLQFLPHNFWSSYPWLLPDSPRFLFRLVPGCRYFFTLRQIVLLDFEFRKTFLITLFKLCVWK